jgi:hypothetical protein
LLIIKKGSPVYLDDPSADVLLHSDLFSVCVFFFFEGLSSLRFFEALTAATPTMAQHTAQTATVAGQSFREMSILMF